MKFLIKVLLPLIFVISGSVAYYGYTEFINFKKFSLSEDVDSFEIKKGWNIRTIAKTLEKKSIIYPALYFIAIAKITKQDTKIKAGEYKLNKGMSPEEVLTLFTKGKTLQYKTRLPEGSTFKDIVEIIKKDKNLKKTLSDSDYQKIMSKLETKYKHHQPEGWFFPDTYNYPKNTTDIEFLQRSHNAMLKVLDEQWKGRKKFEGIKTPYDALILASIVEKETGHPDDRSKVARVFINRLKKDMLLQTDPTVIYGMGDRYKGNIRKKDLKQDTPFNTYTRKGLTPTPISTPSLASIKAVFSPAEGDILYFVAKGDGKSYFSKTYSEHKKAVIKYLLNGKASRYKGNK